MGRSMLRPYGNLVTLSVLGGSWLWSFGLGGEGLGLFRQCGETSGIAHGHVGQHFAIHGNAGCFEAVNQLAVGDAILTSGGTDTLDPQAAILALLHAAIAFCVAIRAIGGFLRGLLELALGEEKAFRALEILFTPGPAFGAAFYAWHGFSPS